MLDGAGADAEIHPNGDSVSTSLLPGESQGFVFAADEGHRYRVSVPATTVRAGRLVVRIFAPDGSMLVESQAVGAGWHWDIGSAQAGTYRVEVDPVAHYAGSVTVRVTDLSDVQLTNLVDESDSVLDLQPGQNGQVRFTATEGTHYRVSVPATTVRAGRLVVRIFAPDGSMLVESQALFDGWQLGHRVRPGRHLPGRGGSGRRLRGFGDGAGHRPVRRAADQPGG